MVMKDKVLQCIAEHEGGNAFFDKLDALIRDDSALMLVMQVMADNMVKEKIGYGYPTYVVSGQFGEKFAQEIDADAKIVKLEGALRFNEIENPEKYRQLLVGEYCVFIDDSYYKGRTYSKARELIENSGGVCLGAVVAYDGSKILQPKIESLFRYYDHFGNK